MSNQRVFIRTSERTQFSHCRQQWEWSYVNRREPRQKSAALMFGDIMHRSLAAYYIPETRKRRRRGPHPAETFEKICIGMERMGRTFGVKADDKWEDAKDLGIVMMENYIKEYGDDKHILIRYPEMPFQYDLYDGDGNYVCTYVGSTDAFGYNLDMKNAPILLEHKSAASISTSHLFLDEQASAYWLIVPLWLKENGIIKEDQELRGMLYNFLRKSKGAEEKVTNAEGLVTKLPTKAAMVPWLKEQYAPEEVAGLLKMSAISMREFIDQRKGENWAQANLGEPSKSQPPPLFHREWVERGPNDSANVYQRIMNQADEMHEVRYGLRPALKSPGKDCGWCSWRDVCEVHEAGGDWKRLYKSMSRPWEPYEDHVWSLDLESSK